MNRTKNRAKRLIENRIFHKYGAPYRRGGHNTMLHLRNDGGVDISFQGECIIEVHPDDTLLLRMPQVISQSVYASLLHGFFEGFHEFRIQRRQRANGTFNTKFTWGKISITPKGIRSQTDVETFDDAAVIKAVPKGDDDHYTFHLLETANDKVTKDNAKYTAFNKKLKRLKTVLIAQAKLGVYDEIGKSNYYTYRSEIHNEVRKICGMENESGYLSYKTIEDRLYELVSAWVEGDEDPASLRAIVLLAANTRISEKSGAENVIRRVEAGLRAAQVTFLREECVKIEDITTSDVLNDSDQSSQLLETTGL